MRTKALVCAFLSLVLIGLILPPATRADELQDAVDNPEQTNGTALIFTSQTSSGGALWSADTTTYTTAPASAKSGHISGNMYSTLTTTVTGPASLSFYQKVSSQASSDTLKFMINGAVKSTISGTVNWQQKLFTLPTGTSTLQWKYSKNATVDGGSDAAWVDKIVVSPFTTVMVTGPTGTLVSGTTTTISWNAPAAADKFGLYYTANGSTWVPIPGASAPNYLPGTGFSDQTFVWTVATPAGNTTKAKVKVVAYNAANKMVAQGMSSVPFAITMLQVTSPNGGQTFNPVTNPTTTVTFMLYGQPTASTATLSYALNTATSGPTITTIPVSGAGAYAAPWLLPAVTKATNARVNVTLKNIKGAAVGTDLSDAVFTILPSYIISGTVTLSGKPLSGVTMNLGGSATATATTDAKGKYALTSLPSGSYTVTPNLTGYSFTPTSASVSITTANVTKNFTAGPVTYLISGKVSGAIQQGVTITLSKAGAANKTTTTAADGSYSFTGLVNGSYTVTPSKTGFTFSPVSEPVTIDGANETAVDFTSAGVTYSISGTVSGAVQQGVTMTLTGAANTQTTTASDGTYSFTGLANGGYTVTPSLAGFTFAPTSKPITISNANSTGNNFTATAVVTYLISGTVSGAVQQGVTMHLTGTANATTITAADGTYSFTGLANGGYTVTPSLTGYAFTPPSIQKNINGSSITAVNFTSSTSSGQLQVTVYNLVSKAGVTVVLGDSTGALVSTAETDTNGVVTFSNPPANATVTAAGICGSTYILRSHYDVNVPAVSFAALDSCVPPQSLGQAILNITCGPGVTYVKRAGTQELCLSSSATLTVPVTSNMVQSDGKVSFVVAGLDISASQTVAYGSSLDNTFVDGMQVNINVDQAPVDYTWMLSNIPNNAMGVNNVSIVRTGAVADVSTTDLGAFLSSAATVTFTTPPGVGTSFTSLASISVDLNADGFPDNQYSVVSLATSPSSTSFDINAFPNMVSNVTVTNFNTAQPTIQWTGSDSTADGIRILLLSSASGTSYSYALGTPTARSSVVFPELPASLSAFSPANWGGQFEIYMGNYQNSTCVDYNDCLTNRNQPFATWTEFYTYDIVFYP